MSELEVMAQCRLLLRGVHVLHARGLGLTRISPGVAASGKHWRLSIAPATSFDPEDPLGWQLLGPAAVLWSSGGSPEYAGLVMTTRTTPDDVADHVVSLLPESTLRGEDMAYTRWYAGLLAECERLEQVPVAFSDSGEHGWQIGWGGPEFPTPPARVNDLAYSEGVSDLVTPRSLELELGVSQRAIRRWLRNEGWQSVPYARWQLTPDQADRVRTHFGTREIGGSSNLPGHLAERT